jgi:surfeit locus 1 family protein
MTRSMIIPLLFGVLGAILFVSLGTWQLQRLEWKQGILAEIDQRMAAEPVALPDNPTEAEDEYLNVTITGTIGEGVAYVLTSQGRPGHRVIVPLQLNDIRTIMAELGFVPEGGQMIATPTGRLTGTGYLIWPDEVDGYTPEPDFATQEWYARDVDRMAETLGTDPILVVLTDADNLNGITPSEVSIHISNRHLEYVFTWFGFAIIWIGMTGLYLWRIKRRPE